MHAGARAKPGGGREQGNKLEARPDPAAAKSLEYQARGRGLPPGAAEGPLLGPSRESGLPRRVAGVTNPPANTGDRQVQSLGLQDPLEEEMATCSSILAWEIPWIEEPGGLQGSWGHKGSDTTRRLSAHTLEEAVYCSPP